MPDFLTLAYAAYERGFPVVPVMTGEKTGTQDRWNKFPHRTKSEIALTAHDFPCANIGIVSKRSLGNLLLFDDDSGAIALMEVGTGEKVSGVTLTVLSRPDTDPTKRHAYLLQTEYSLLRLGNKTVSVKDSTKWKQGKSAMIHPERYAIRGIGGAAYVVGAGSVRDDGQVYRYEDESLVPIPISPKQVDWLADEFKKSRSAVAKAARQTQTEKKEGDLPFSSGETYDALRAYICRLASWGMDHKDIEAALHPYAVAYCENGAEYVRVHRLQLHKMVSKKKVIPPSVKRHITQPKKTSTMIEKKITRVLSLEEVIENCLNGFSKISSGELYEKITAACTVSGNTFGRAQRMSVSRVMRRTGWTAGKKGLRRGECLWVRNL